MLSTVLMSTNETVQFKLTLSKELDERLRSLAKKYGKKSGQDVAIEIINVYLPVWISVNDSMNRALTHQLTLITDDVKEKENKIKKNNKETDFLNETNKIGTVEHQGREIPVYNESAPDESEE